jgi:dolichol-phosphate mannosyltransferase
MSTPPQLSVVIPAYNEAAVIADTVHGLLEALTPTGWSFEIVVADDGSSDDTWAILTALAQRFVQLEPVRNGGPGGYGMAVRRALEASTGEAVIVAMADGSDPPDDVVTYARLLLDDGYDCAFGTRFRGWRGPPDYPFVKFVLNRLGNLLVALVTWTSYNDFTNGFKGYRRPVIAAMQPLVCADFNLTVEMSMKAVLGGAAFKVVPNRWHDRQGGVSKFKLGSAGPRYLLTILYCRLDAHLRRAGARPRHEPVAAARPRRAD